MRIWFARLAHRMGLILGSPTPWIFLGGLLAIGLITNGASNLIDVQFSTPAFSGNWISIIAGIVIIIAVLVSFDLSRLLHRTGDFSISGTSPIPKYRGLITVVSFGTYLPKLPSYCAISYHMKPESHNTEGLEYCWLLAGPGVGETSSISNAEKLKQEFSTKGIKEIFIIQLADSDNPKEVFDCVIGIYMYAKETLKLSPEDIFTDFTGGTKSMTFGLGLACADHGWPLGFMKPDKYDQDGRPSNDSKSEPCKIDVTFYSDLHSPQ